MTEVIPSTANLHMALVNIPAASVNMTAIGTLNTDVVAVWNTEQLPAAGSHKSNAFLGLLYVVF